MSPTFETSNPDEALDYVKRVYDTNFRVMRTSDPFHMNHDRTEHGPWTSDAMALTAGGLRAEPYGFVSVGRQRSGRARLTAGRDTLLLQTGDVFVMSDGAQAFTASCADGDATFLRLSVRALEKVADEAAAPPSGARFAFLSRRPITARAGRRLTSVIGFSQRHLADGDVPPVGALRTAIGDLLAATVLTTFPNTLVAEPSDLALRHDVPTTVQLALDFVARNADLPITCADIAAHASVSRRTLEMAFREHLATSPAAYLRQYRLGCVREELTAAEPGDGTSVTEVAARWGFTGSSRFAAQYRDAYDEQPSRTLRSARPAPGR